MAALTLDSISRSFDEHFLPYVTTLRQRQQGRKFANESYVSYVKFFEGSAGVVLVNGGVYRSQRRNEDVHKVDISVKDDKIVDAFCSCTAGISGECAHVLAVVYKITDWILEGLHDVPVQPACTSMPQQWDRPRGRKIVPEPVSTMVIAKPGNMNRKKRPLVADFTDNRNIQLLTSDIDHLNSLAGSPISYLASYPDETVTTDHGIQNLGSALAYQLPLTEPVEGPSGQIIPCSDLVYPKHPDVLIDTRDDEDWSAVALSQDAAVLLERNTRQQSNSTLWFQERKKRITSSNFGRFMIRKIAVTQKFVDSVQKQKPFSSEATSYGSSSEKVARNMYRKQTGNHVHECGFVVNPAFPYIGASPDGKVCDPSGGGILEIKCPFSIRDMTILEGLSVKRDVSQFHLELIDNDIKLKRNHSYFFQVQGQLLITGAQFCDFVTFTRCDLVIERIFPDKGVFNQLIERFRSVCTKFKCF